MSHRALLAAIHVLHLVLLCVCESALSLPAVCLPASSRLIAFAAVLVFASLRALRALSMDEGRGGGGEGRENEK